jgi:hypothetical protein
MMPGLLLSMLVAGVVGARDEPKDLTAFASVPGTDRRSQLSAPRPPVALDAEVLLYAGMPIDIDGETKYVGNLSFYRTLQSLAICDEGRFAAVVAYFDQPTFPYGTPEGYAVVRERVDGSLAILANQDSPLIGYATGRVGHFGFANAQSQSRAALLPDGSYRLFAHLLFESPDFELAGDWIVDIDDEGIHPVLRLQGLVDMHPQTDLSLPIGGIRTFSGTPGRLGWRLEGREVVFLANLLDNPLTSSTPVLGYRQFIVPLADGSILAPFGIVNETLKSFFGRVGEESVSIDFECVRGRFPSLPDGSERLTVSTEYRGHATENGYFVPLRGIAGGVTQEITIAKFGDEIRRFIDDQTFNAFPPYNPSGSEQAISSTNNRGDVIASRANGPGGDFNSYAAYFGGPDNEWIPVIATGGGEQLGVYSGASPYFSGPLRRTITHDGTFVFSIDANATFNRGHIAWSIERGYRLLHVRGDFLSLPGDAARPTQPFWSHVGQDPLNTTIFAVAQFIDDPDIEWKDAIIRQSLDSAHPLSDLNRDGEVNLLDLNILLRPIGPGEQGSYRDIDFDGQVDENDLQMILDQWGQR